MSAIATPPRPQNGMAIDIPGVVATDVGIVIPKDISSSDYRSIGSTLGRFTGATAWAVGDWVNANPSKRTTMHEVTQEVADIVGLTIGTVAEYARIARKFPHERRRPKLAWGLHQSVASLPEEEQERLLDQAEKHGWPISAIRLKVGQKPEPLPKGTVTVVGSPRFAVTVEWKPEIVEDPDLVETLTVELRRMIQNWEFVKTVTIGGVNGA